MLGYEFQVELLVHDLRLKDSLSNLLLLQFGLVSVLVLHGFYLGLFLESFEVVNFNVFHSDGQQGAKTKQLLALVVLKV